MLRFIPNSLAAYRQAILHAFAGEPEAALAALERAMSVYPHDLREVATVLEALSTHYPGRFEALLGKATDALPAAAPVLQP